VWRSVVANEHHCGKGARVRGPGSESRQSGLTLQRGECQRTAAVVPQKELNCPIAEAADAIVQNECSSDTLVRCGGRARGLGGRLCHAGA
jgi:hypothetical protein